MFEKIVIGIFVVYAIFNIGCALFFGDSSSPRSGQDGDYDG